MPYRWNATAHRYQSDNGRFVKRDQVLQWVQQSLTSASSVTDVLGSMVANGQLSSADWKKVMRDEIKGEYIRQYLLGNGGRNTMTKSDWGRVGGMLAEQYKYLDGFAKEIGAGGMAEGYIQSRSAMYINSAREAYERAHAGVAGKWGADEESWSVNTALENCVDCLGYADEGWQPLGHFPMPGEGASRCLTNCGCVKEYRKSSTGEIFEEAT